MTAVLQSALLEADHPCLYTLRNHTGARIRALLTCSGFGFEEMFGKGYYSLSKHKRERATRAAGVAGLLWANSGEKSGVISRSCLKTSPSRRELAQPFGNCCAVLERSNFRNALSTKAPSLDTTRYFPFLRVEVSRISACRDEKTSVWICAVTYHI